MHCLLKTSKPIIRLSNYPGYIYLIENDDSISHKVDLTTFIRFLEGYSLCGDLLYQFNQLSVKQKLFASFVNMAIFILIKLDDLDEGMKILNEFENSLDFNIKLNFKPLNIVNTKIVNGQFKQAKILLKLMNIVYNNKRMKNHIFIHMQRLREL